MIQLIVGKDVEFEVIGDGHGVFLQEGANEWFIADYAVTPDLRSALAGFEKEVAGMLHRFIDEHGEELRRVVTVA
jgi:hypothetical protein